MSEPSSFFLHVHITEENLEQYFASPAKDVADYTDWTAWFSEKKRMYGDPVKMLNELKGCNAGSSRDNIYAEHINYDKEKQILTMDHIFLGENFGIYMPLTTCLRGLESYITPATQNNFLVIYPYWWGGGAQGLSPETSIYLEFADGHSHLLSKTREENIAIAQAFFDEYGEELARELYDKQGYI
ncbi:hypothetical protein SOASR030_26790 [Leminorella grimontii]|uniref:Cytoplasmic protein n=1 Tax=Leminorella grimontii TaxID=82981 RepID=A0AAV5N892_9GAMM|nr:hypothetical protein [Leminorella grimontii]KFC94823.1 putative cytoplasmic protein [Leminorella grimontii ATCC 33999 = DSM 5078]GKX56567.1 hypothetical protein SOASR030_26790 [Leminorella grimontii]GKX59832.1 hypothetical protein SOASR031_21470 [Leminorella grimontii]VFS61656.1 Uncharacterised protein [Leminorella grimontii]